MTCVYTTWWVVANSFFGRSVPLRHEDWSIYADIMSQLHLMDDAVVNWLTGRGAQRIWLKKKIGLRGQQSLEFAGSAAYSQPQSPHLLVLFSLQMLL